MAKRSLKPEQELEIEDDNEEEDDPESEIEEETESDEDEEEERVVERGKRIMIRVVPVQRSGSQSGLESCCSSSGGGGYLGCQADECGMDLSNAKIYHRRHKVCERHAKAAVVLVKGIRQRFCQQCSRFHEISEFDDSKRSCRSRLAGHNERRRKSQTDLRSEDGQEPPMSKLNGSSLKATKVQNHGGMTSPGSLNTKHFRIR